MTLAEAKSLAEIMGPLIRAPMKADLDAQTEQIHAIVLDHEKSDQASFDELKKHVEHGDSHVARLEQKIDRVERKTDRAALASLIGKIVIAVLTVIMPAVMELLHWLAHKPH